MTFDKERVKARAIQSGKWALLAQLLPRIITPFLAIVLARLLTPTDYGIVATGTIVVSLLINLSQVGINSTLVQIAGNVDDATHTGFWLNIGFNALSYALLFTLAPLLAGFYGEPRATPVIRLLGLQLLISMLGSVQNALLQRDFHFRALFLVQVLPGVLSLAVSIPMALAGMGYWSLVAGTLSNKALSTLMLWVANSWKPKFHFTPALVKPLVGFSLMVVLELVGGWLLFQGDNLTVGAVLGMKAMGVYTVGFNLTLMFVRLPLGAITGVTLPAFSRLQNDLDALRRAYLAGTRLVVAIALPVGVGLALISKPFVQFAYADKWQGLETVFPILALYAGFTSIFTLNSDAFKAINRPDVIPKLFLIIVPLNLLVFWFSAPFGLLVFTLARSTDALFSAPFHYAAAVKLLRLPKTYLWDVLRSPLLAVGVMAVGVMGVSSWLGPLPILVRLFVLVVVGVAMYTSCLWVADRDLVLMMVRNAKRVLLDRAVASV